jgi:hypothetical protein
MLDQRGGEGGGKLEGVLPPIGGSMMSIRARGATKETELSFHRMHEGERTDILFRGVEPCAP